MWFVWFPAGWVPLWRPDGVALGGPVPAEPAQRRLDRTSTLRLGAIDGAVTVADALELEALTHLLVDDLCLQACRLGVAARKPPWWSRRARRAWQLESLVLDGWQRRLEREAAGLGAWVTPTGRRRGGAEP